MLTDDFLRPTQKLAGLLHSPIVRVLAGTFALLSCSQSHAEPSLYHGGLNYAHGMTYTYAEKLTPLAGETLGRGWYSKFRLSWLRYHYDVTQILADVKVRANRPGLDAGMGYAWRGEAFKLDLSAFAGYRYVDLSPTVPTDDKTGGMLTLTPQVQASLRLHPVLDADLIAYHTIGLHSNFVRTRLGWRANPTWRIGVESSQQNGDNYRKHQLGLFTAMPLSQGMSIDLQAGRVESRGARDTMYMGVGVSRVY